MAGGTIAETCRTRRTTVDDIERLLEHVDDCDGISNAADATVPLGWLRAAAARLRGADGWQCRCGCHTYARVDVDTAAGFKPGDFVRCVSCKAVSYFPECAAAPPASPAPQSDVLAEIGNLVEATLTRGDLQYGLGQIADVARRARRGA